MTMRTCDFCGRTGENGFPVTCGEDGWRLSYESIRFGSDAARDSRYACRECAKERLGW